MIFFVKQNVMYVLWAEWISFSQYLFALCFRPIMPWGTIQASTSQSAKFAASSGISDWVNDFFFFRSLSLFLLLLVFFFFFFSFATWWSQTSEQGRKVAVTNKLILWSTERCLRGCLQAYSLAFLPSFFVALALYPSNVLFLLSSSIPAISNSKGKKKKKKKRKKRKEATGN